MSFEPLHGFRLSSFLPFPVLGGARAAGALGSLDDWLCAGRPALCLVADVILSSTHFQTQTGPHSGDEPHSHRPASERAAQGLGLLFAGVEASPFVPHPLLRQAVWCGSSFGTAETTPQTGLGQVCPPRSQGEGLSSSSSASGLQEPDGALAGRLAVGWRRAQTGRVAI